MKFSYDYIDNQITYRNYHDIIIKIYTTQQSNNGNYIIHILTREFLITIKSDLQESSSIDYLLQKIYLPLEKLLNLNLLERFKNIDIDIRHNQNAFEKEYIDKEFSKVVYSERAESTHNIDEIIVPNTNNNNNNKDGDSILLTLVCVTILIFVLVVAPIVIVHVLVG